jgi:hypothetical protein
MTRGGVETQSTLTVDVADAQRPLAIKDVWMAVGHRHHYFVQAHGFTSRLLLTLPRRDHAKWPR